MYELSDASRETLMTRATECLGDFSSISEKIERARELFGRHREALKNEEYIRGLMEELEGAIVGTWKMMREKGIVDACCRCDTEEGGSCCGRGIEDKFDALLLLMNLALGVSLPDARERADSCFFLKEDGCSLKVRLVLCVDYLCPKILGWLPHRDLVELQEVSGVELTAGFRLYDAIKRFLRQREGEAAPDRG